MKIVQVNTFSNKSTGNIMMNIHKILIAEGHDSYVCWGRGRNAENDHEIAITDNWGVKLHGAYTRLFDRTGFASNRATKKLLNRLDEIAPDIIHLHNLHGYYINIEMLFEYIKLHNIKVVWTLHDCWAFTGHCAWFDMCGCEKWKTGCNHCEQLNTYPASKGLDSSEWNWNKKKSLFTGCAMTLVAPCNWLANLVNMSFLREQDVKVIYNGIDLNVFKPTQIDGLREKYNLDERPIILGVASEWTQRKGLHDFIEMSQRMKDIQFVVVGLTDAQMKNIPDTLKGIKWTNSATELAGLYSLAELFFNPTYEDNFPTTNLEALACGTPVVTYDTGGSPEAVSEGTKAIGNLIGYVIRKTSSKSVNYMEVEKTLADMPRLVKLEKMSCHNASKIFDMNIKLRQYLNLYESIMPYYR